MEENKQITIDEIVNKLDNKNFNLYFYCLDTKGSPTAGVANIYEHVKILNEMGYKASILHDDETYHGVGEWLGEEYANLPHLAIKSKEVNVRPEDFIIIPEIFATLMQQIHTNKLPAKRVVLAQNYAYMLELLPLGMKWSDYGFMDVITTNNNISDYIKKHFPSVSTHVVPVSIPEYFKPYGKKQLPSIALFTRDQSNGMRIIKSFYLQNPQYKWVPFRYLNGLNREDFAKELSKCCVSVWADDVAGFGTFPLESFECEVPIIAKVPDMIPEYMVDVTETDSVKLKENGIWSTSLDAIPSLISTYMKLWLEDSVPTDIIENMKNSKGQYTPEKQKAELLSVYELLVANRKDELLKTTEITNK
jgi:hypothetical protein